MMVSKAICGTGDDDAGQRRRGLSILWWEGHGAGGKPGRDSVSEAATAARWRRRR